MATLSAGILVVRRAPTGLEFLLVHPGGPFWSRKDLGAWSIPKGEHGPDEDPLAAAEREFAEELGMTCPPGDRVALGMLRQRSGKLVTAWCVVGDLDLSTTKSNTFEIEWPPKSGRQQSFPEVDRAEFFAPAIARQKVLAGQVPFIDRALRLVEQPS